MTNLFNITTATNSIPLNAQRTGKASFTVTNISPNAVRARARITSSDASITPWFTIEGELERLLAPVETTQYTVRIAVPPTAAAKDYPFSLLMVDANNPDENFTEGPGVKLMVPQAPTPPKKPFPWWIIAVVVAVIIVIVIAIVLIVNGNNQAKANATATQNAVNTATTVANGAATQTAAAAQTQTAAVLTQTAAAIQTQTAVAGLTQTAVAIMTQTAAAAQTQTAFPLTQTALVPTATRPPDGFITIKNGAGVVAQGQVTYDTPGGQRKDFTGQILLGQDATLDIPGAATNINLSITFSGARISCARHYNQATSVTISLTGTIFDPNCIGG